MLKGAFLTLLIALAIFVRSQSFLSGSGIELYNPYLVNPAFIANDSMVNIDAIYYNRGVELEGSPEELNIAGNVPLSKIKSGILVNYNRYLIGNFINNGFGIGYAYHYQINKVDLHAGLKTNIKVQGLKEVWIGAQDSNDTLLPKQEQGKNYLIDNSYGLGITYKMFKGGLSIVGHNIYSEGNYFMNEKAWLHAFASYNYKLNSRLQFEPMVGWYVEDKVELSLISTIFQNYRLGVSYRFGDRSDFIFSANKETLFSLSAGATIFEHAYVNVVFNPDYFPVMTDVWGYTLLAQVGCRF